MECNSNNDIRRIFSAAQSKRPMELWVSNTGGKRIFLCHKKGSLEAGTKFVYTNKCSPRNT